MEVGTTNRFAALLLLAALFCGALLVDRFATTDRAEAEADLVAARTPGPPILLSPTGLTE
jgi:hypothetical protein